MIKILAKLECLVWMVGDRETVPKIATRPTSREGCIVPHWDGAGRRTTVNSKQAGAFFGVELGNCATFAEVNLSAQSLLYGIEHFNPILRKTFCAEVGGGRSSQSISLCRSRDLWELLPPNLTVLSPVVQKIFVPRRNVSSPTGALHVTLRQYT